MHSALILLTAVTMPLTATSDDATGVEFFEKRIRPVLARRCFECHATNAEKVKGGLVLDSKPGWTKGGDSGPAIVAGDPEKSLLVRAIRYGDPDLQMPPTGKLPDGEIAAIVEWIKLGAPDPRVTPPSDSASAAASKGRIDVESGREFWAFRPPQKSPTPQVKRGDWPRGDIDQFILARLERAGLTPANDADRATLVRRIHFDLIGMPPSVQEIDEFLHDQSVDAVARLIDQLLESPRFGERWGRHWLDVARHADSSGGGRSLLFPNAWRFRDYVIDSFQRDKPFDQFIREQIAGDLAPADSDAERADQLVATAFLMIGAHNYELQDKDQLRMDVVDEQIEAIGRAFLGMTLGCARCHDHKFDPIPTTDYYALAGILRSTKSLTPGNVAGFEGHELPVSAERRASLDRHVAAVKRLQGRLDLAKAELKKIQAETRVASLGKDGPRDALIGIVVDDTEARLVGDWTKSKYNLGYVGEGYIHDGAGGKGEKSVTFPVRLPHDGDYEVRLSYTHGTNRSPSVPVTVRHGDDEETVQIDERQEPPIDKRFIALGRWPFKKGTSEAVTISNEGTTSHVIVDAVQFIPVELLEKQAADIDPKKSPVAPTSEQRNDLPLPATKPALQETELKVKQLEADLKKLQGAAPEPAPLTMGVKDEKEPGDFRICIRGDVHNVGADVPRGFLTVASAADASRPVIAAGQSGRRELADWLASPENPLTARVTVNRVWHHLFGVGLVRTTDNFGATGEKPSHVELLDWLAIRFIEQGWSTKNLIREIMLSRTYQLASEVTADLRPSSSSNQQSTISNSSDPENRLLARQNRKRLDAEALRDAMLAVSGRIDLARGGPSMRDKTQSEYGYVFDSLRRSAYLPVFRNNLPEIFEVFDFADPNTVTGRRNISTLTAQALFLMNSPFVMDQARHAAEAILELDSPDADRIELAYRRTLGRLPTPAERDLAVRYVRDFKSVKATDVTAQRLQAWTRFYQALFASIDFRYLY